MPLNPCLHLPSFPDPLFLRFPSEKKRPHRNNNQTSYNKTSYIPHIKAGWGNPLGRKEPQKQAKEWESPIPTRSSFVRSPTRTPHYTTTVHEEDLSQTHACSLMVAEPYEAWLVGSVVRFLVVLFCSSTGFPKLCLAFGCGSLHLFPSAAPDMFWKFILKQYQYTAQNGFTHTLPRPDGP